MLHDGQAEANYEADGSHQPPMTPRRCVEQLPTENPIYPGEPCAASPDETLAHHSVGANERMVACKTPLGCAELAGSETGIPLIPTLATGKKSQEPRRKKYH